MNQPTASAMLGTALIGIAGWLTLRNLRLDQLNSWSFWLPLTVCLFTMGLLCWWTVLAGQQEKNRARIRASWRAGWALGAIGLVVGFLGPLVMTPSANLGPLLGILMTGPGGFVLGAVGSALATRT
jgi:hypothetical protein